ncbi:MAG: hypothetical protein B6244_09295 [Candidatus Cloacimonetes bacterium 4572_55]|nr:MAG: hypothetical protein B6244_09295 [Candidatus Cloacimonetes bacterium 4572_55]
MELIKSYRNKTHCPKKIEFGDFQTPILLADYVCDFLLSNGVLPKSIIEPTCGEGNFIGSAINKFNTANIFLGVEINDKYYAKVSKRLSGFVGQKVKLINTNFFMLDWQKIINELSDPILILGNPPWVTNSKLGSLDSKNLPPKSNFQNHKGFDAITGKANFDISEWMLIHLIKCLQGKISYLAMLCKTSVARKVLKFCWLNNYQLEQTSLHLINAKEHFGASVDACLLFCTIGAFVRSKTCQVYQNLEQKTNISTLGLYNTELVSNFDSYKKWLKLDDKNGKSYKWRSGIKHDCAKVMELTKVGDKFENGFGETTALEQEYLYPLLKSSDVAKNEVRCNKRWVLVTQKRVGEDTSKIKKVAPKTWDYLCKYSDSLAKRKSSIYKNKPPFSIFGVGDYSFSLWKVAISSLYKRISFSVINPYNNRCSMVDDTCYLIPCKSEDEAILLAQLLNSNVAKEFLNSLIFWDAKRPITTSILQRINLEALAEELKLADQFNYYTKNYNYINQGESQLRLFETPLQDQDYISGAS